MSFSFCKKPFRKCLIDRIAYKLRGMAGKAVGMGTIC